MTGGSHNSNQQSDKKTQETLAKVYPQGIKCQKCLGRGHWSYQCQNKQKILVRPSRSQILKKNLQTKETESSKVQKEEKEVKTSKKRKWSDSSSSSAGGTDNTEDNESRSSDPPATLSDDVSDDGSKSSSMSD